MPLDLFTSRLVPLAPTLAQLHRSLARSEQHAEELAGRGRTHLNNSIEDGHGMFAGMLGEQLLYDYFHVAGRPTLEWTPAERPYDFDLRFLSAPRLSIDVKTKRQESTATPAMFWNATVCDKNTFQKCDIYVFVRTVTNAEQGWLLGWLPKAEFMRLRTFGRRGDPDPTSHCGFRFAEDCWNVPAGKLWPITTPEEMQEAFLRFQTTGETCQPIGVDGYLLAGV